MRKYECTMSFDLEEYDENGNSIENETLTVNVGTVWSEDDKSSYNFVAGSDAYRLVQITKDEHSRWIEIYGDRLEECFTELEEDK
ncbi:hypothetical protein CIL05_07675 [Virgibacillus profundi]|uniref:Uncharacterized protein n=1 Tax=Virgibacillus profundi TaxID=2024555 RepID=A0A2A2IE96_9BACI|nr:hypothetical protein [Virgibacillus profundi]PAV30341.1 hypothetical protein CIL05_07675 [Virgibacillus profundi]PXY54513.1 hypothetical protein CIT14_07760 [Virgibacillus profundi]